MLFSEIIFSLGDHFRKGAEERKMEEKVFRNCLEKEKKVLIFTWPAYLDIPQYIAKLKG